MKAARDKLLWTREMTAEEFSVSTKTIDNWTREGILTALRIGGKVYYRSADVRALIEKPS